MSKNIVVVFTKNNARILKNIQLENIDPGLQHIVNPDLSKLRGIPPQYWKLQDGAVVAMDAQERLKRLEDIENEGVVNSVFKPVREELSEDSGASAEASAEPIREVQKEEPREQPKVVIIEQKLTTNKKDKVLLAALGIGCALLSALTAYLLLK